MLIRDNGDGFEPEKIKMGNGINNIRKRAKEIKGHCEILASKDGGTSVRVYFKTA
jgi:signal transduction histidine kinase